MKISNLQTFNFRGLEGTKTYDFKDIMVILQKNATGKSSFIDALIYALAGIEPEGDMIHTNATQCGVQITFEDGTKYSRMRPRNGQTVYRINKTKATKKNFEASLAQACGVTSDTIKVVTSSDVLRSMKPSELSDFFLQYIGEKLTIDSLIQYIDDNSCTDDMETMAKSVAAKIGIPDKFGINTVDALYKSFYDYRKKYNAEAKDSESRYKVLMEQSEGIPEDADREKLLEEREMLEKEREKMSVYKTEYRAYQYNIQKYDTALSNITNLEKQINDIKITDEKTEAEYDAEKQELSNRITKEQAYKNAANQTVAGLETTKEYMENAYSKLESTTCPLSDSLTCTTDKTVIKNEMKMTIDSLNTQIATQKKIALQHQEEETRLTEQIYENEKAKAQVIKKKMLENQRDTIRNNLGEKPKEPVKPVIKDLSRIDTINLILSKMEKKEDAKKMEEIKDKKQRYASAFDGLVKAFAPKGIVKNNIINDYLHAFEEECNKVAEKLRPGMRYRFESDNGITISVDMNGNGTYLRYESLSGGERSVMLLILMTMLNSLTGFSIIIMDEMSVLDAKTFGDIVSLLWETRETRDHAIIASVNHTDTLKEVTKRKIPVYEI